MASDLLALIDDYNNAEGLVMTYGNRIMAIICDCVRDVIPDIRGVIGDLDDDDILIFRSYEYEIEKRLETMKDGVPNNWRRFYFLIEKVFPELEFKVDDNGIYLSPEEQDEIIKRLKKLRGEEK